MNHLSEQVIHDYRQRQLSPTQLLAVDEHLANCDQCHLLLAKGHLNPGESAAALYEELLAGDPTTDDHLSYEILEAIVDRDATAVDQEIVKVHLEVCSQCTAELRSLEELRVEKPISVPPRVDIRKKALSGWLTWPRLGLATFATLMIAAVIWFVWKSQFSSQEPTETQIASASPSPTDSSSPISTPSVSPSPEIVVSLRDAGRIVTVDQTGKIEGLGDVSPFLKEAIRDALWTEQVNTAPTFAGLRGKGGTLMGGANEGIPFRLLSPVGVVVESDHPTFVWEPYDGATTYVVKVYDSDFNELATSLSQTATSWKTPAPLPRGAIYTWQVTAIKNGKEIKSPIAPAPQIRFRVLDQDHLNEIKRIQNDKPISHLALGTRYARSGLLEDARREFQLLLKANPRSTVVHKLIQSVNVR